MQGNPRPEYEVGIRGLERYLLDTFRWKLRLSSARKRYEEQGDFKTVGENF